MGWISYEIPDLTVRGQFRLDQHLAGSFAALCAALIEVMAEQDDEPTYWEDLTGVLKNDFEFIPESMTTEAVKQAIYHQDASVLNFHQLTALRYDFYLIDEALERMDPTLLLTPSAAESKFDHYGSVFGTLQGDYLLVSESNTACIGLQMNATGLFLPEWIEAYDDNYGSDYIPDAPDIFEAGTAPHRAFFDILEDDGLTEYMAYRFAYRQPEGDESTREYAEYRDVFGPMRLECVNIKLGAETFLTVTRHSWHENDFVITLTRGSEKTKHTEFLEELATKHTKNLLHASLVEWLQFFMHFHEALQLHFTETERGYLEKLLA